MEALELLIQTETTSTLLFKDTCAKIYHIQDANVIHIQVEGLTKNQCYQANSERTLTFLARFGSTKMLVDFGELMMMNNEDRCWTEEVWQKQASQVGLKNLAVIMPANLFAALSINKMMDNIKKNAPWQTETFTEETQAYDWIRNK